MEIQTKKFAVLIDADNSSINAIASVLEEVAKYGIASVKRVYGDWSNDALKKWRDVLLPHAITPVQQFAYTKGKDATDMILIIDAMDLLYAGALDGFCIVSSDSDFTPLASRIRESGLIVYGFGRKKTPEPFKKACDKFISIENLITEEKEEEKQNIDVKNIEDIKHNHSVSAKFRKCFVICFTSRTDSRFLWETYAGDKGINFGVDLIKFKKFVLENYDDLKNDIVDLRFDKVIYDSDEQINMLKKCIRNESLLSFFAFYFFFANICH